MEAANRKRYNQVWKHASLPAPHIWPSWEIVKEFQGKRCLDIGCGNYPKVPLQGSVLLDLSDVATSNLRAKGFHACVGSAENLPFANNTFDLVIAWEVLEHIEHDNQALSEISRVLKERGYFFLSVPLGQHRFSQVDIIAGHKRRYEPQELAAILQRHKLAVIKFRCPRLLKYLEEILGVKLMVNKVYSCPAHTHYFGCPKPLLNLFIRIWNHLNRISAGSWKTGPLQELGDEIEIHLLCRKTRQLSHNIPTHSERSKHAARISYTGI